jgi:hypothetical protein
MPHKKMLLRGKAQEKVGAEGAITVEKPKATETLLGNAVSVASLLRLSEANITEIPEPADRPMVQAEQGLE